MSVKNKINHINVWLKNNTSIDEKISFIKKFETGQSNPTFLLKSNNKAEIILWPYNNLKKYKIEEIELKSTILIIPRLSDV